MKPLELKINVSSLNFSSRILDFVDHLGSHRYIKTEDEVIILVSTHFRCI